MSPFLRKKFPPIESFESDINKLGEVLYARDIRLVGGEPLLNPEISSFAKIARKSAIAQNVVVSTNGLLLHKMKDDFWENVDLVLVTLYPGLSPNEKQIQMLKNRAEESKTRLMLFSKHIFRTTIVTKPHRKDWITDMIFKTCKNAHLFHCHMVHEGRLYKCAVPPFLPKYLSRMGADAYDPSQDAFDIHKTNDTFKQLKKFLTSRKTLEACRYCLGYVGIFQEHHQLTRELVFSPGLQNINRNTHFDRFKLLKEFIRYYNRRLVEKMTGEGKW